MLKLTTLSDAQSELMQGGTSYYPKKKHYDHKHPCCHKSTTHKSISVVASQKSDNLALTLGGKYGNSANNIVDQSMGISIYA